MAETLGRTRSAFRLPRVEVDLAAILVSAAGWLAYQFVWPLLAMLLGVSGLSLPMAGKPPLQVAPAVVLREAFFRPVLSGMKVDFPGRRLVAEVVGYPNLLVVPGEQPNTFVPVAVDVGAWKLVAAAAVMLLFVSIFGGAVARIYALRKARDESIRFDDALAFSIGSLRQFVTGHLFIVAAIALFGALALAAGAGTAIPYAGPVLQLVLHPAAILAALVLTVFLVGALLGYPLLIAAVAVERNGGLDAVSRTYSYAFARPVTYGIGAALVLAVAGVMAGFAGVFVHAVEWALERGSAWNPSAHAAIDAGLVAAQRFATPALAEGTGGLAAASAWVTWVFGTLTALLVRGFVAAYVAGGFVDLYFILREEVEGVAASEVHVEGVTADLGEPLAGQPQ